MTTPDPPTNEERMLAFLESLDMDGFKRAPLEDPVQEVLAQIREVLYPDGEPEDDRG